MGDTVTRVCEFLVLCRRPGYRRRWSTTEDYLFGTIQIILENDNIARVLANQLNESLDSPPPILNNLGSTKYDSEPQHRAYLAHQLLLKRFDTSPSAESDGNYVGLKWTPLFGPRV